MDTSIGYVIVTYNRLDQLKIAINSVLKQEAKPDYLVIVDNNSSDGTDIFLNDMLTLINPSTTRIIVKRLDANYGGAAGFRKGIEILLSMNVDWICLADDDAYIEDGFIRTFKDLNTIEGFLDDVCVICPAVVTNNEISLHHRKRIIKHFLTVDYCPYDISAYKKSFFEVDVFSFVGPLIRSDCIREIGLPRNDFFIWQDDLEYSLRLKKKGKAICFPQLMITHDVKSNDNPSGWKRYYGYRNGFEVLRLYFGKRYVFYLIIKYKLSYYKAKLQKRINSDNSSYFDMINDAIFDYRHKYLGKNLKYLP